LIRNIVVGLNAVPDEVREAARGMGFRPLAELARVDLPLAFPGILAGVRIATVTTIGLVTVTALIGEGGLGSLIYDGLLRDFKTPLVVGTVLCVALAVLSDLGLAGLQRVVTPWARSRAVPWASSCKSSTGCRTQPSARGAQASDMGPRTTCGCHAPRR